MNNRNVLLLFGGFVVLISGVIISLFLGYKQVANGGHHDPVPFYTSSDCEYFQQLGSCSNIYTAHYDNRQAKTIRSCKADLKQLNGKN